MKIRILDHAEDDLIQGFAFYEKQQAGIGAYFLDSLASVIDSLLLYAGTHPTHFGRYYRLLSKRFPFAVYYPTSDDVAWVHAVLDCRRDPAWIREHLRE
ncbi:MAG: type II toxin-antitoxin system RelE/ParE family toxin [Verrucomicrobiota bacterium]|nr:type II toxin-antitoxin system RelE/ParE family toxin [Verrucomicrobiota bacterium]